MFNFLKKVPIPFNDHGIRVGEGEFVCKLSSAIVKPAVAALECVLVATGEQQGERLKFNQKLIYFEFLYFFMYQFIKTASAVMNSSQVARLKLLLRAIIDGSVARIIIENESDITSKNKLISLLFENIELRYYQYNESYDTHGEEAVFLKLSNLVDEKIETQTNEGVGMGAVVVCIQYLKTCNYEMLARDGVRAIVA